MSSWLLIFEALLKKYQHAMHGKANNETKVEKTLYSLQARLPWPVSLTMSWFLGKLQLFSGNLYIVLKLGTSFSSNESKRFEVSKILNHYVFHV